MQSELAFEVALAVEGIGLREALPVFLLALQQDAVSWHIVIVFQFQNVANFDVLDLTLFEVDASLGVFLTGDCQTARHLIDAFVLLPPLVL